MKRNNNKTLPLYKTTHWRKIREIYNTLCNYESIDPSMYDFYNITCYSIKNGDNLLCKNLTVENNTGGYPFVYDNAYDIYEAPVVNSHESCPISGRFLMLAHDKSFDYWMMLRMNHKIVNNEEHVTYHPYGRYTISANKDNLAFIKTEYGRNLDYGAFKRTSDEFDTFNIRKHAYHYTNSILLSQKLGFKNNLTSIKGGQEVKKYHKHKK